MNNTDISKTNYQDILLWLAIVLISIGAFAATYYLNISGPIVALVWIGWLVSTLAFGFFTSKGKQVFLFAQEAKIELEKVVWPTRQETIQTTSIVMIMVTVTGFILWGIDSSMMWAIGKITHLG